MNPFTLGAIINSALYLSAVFVAGISTDHPDAWKLAIVAIGMTYLSHVFGMFVVSNPTKSNRVAQGLVVFASIVVGIFAALALRT